MTRKFKRWSTIPSISTKQTTISQSKSLKTKKDHWHMSLEIQVMAWDRQKYIVWLNWS